MSSGLFKKKQLNAEVKNSDQESSRLLVKNSHFDNFCRQIENKKQCLKEILRNLCMFQSIIKHFANICRISDILYAINRAGGKSENLGRGQSIMQVFYGTGFEF